MTLISLEGGAGFRRSDLAVVRQGVENMPRGKLADITSNFRWETGNWLQAHGTGTSGFGDAFNKYKFASMRGGDGCYHVSICVARNMRADIMAYVLRFKFDSPPTEAKLRAAVYWGCDNYGR